MAYGAAERVGSFKLKLIINSVHMKKIVFIEDEPLLQKTAGETLRQEGFDVRSALDGEAGLALVKSFKPDLVLLDIVLPKKNGFEVLEEIKKDPDTKDIPVIVLTNLEGSADVEKVLESGAMTYMVKANYNLEEIVARVKSILEASGR